MGFRAILGGCLLVCSMVATADFEMFKDYEMSEAVVSMTTVRVSAGKGEDYLEGLKQTWVASNEVAKELGHIEDFSIYASQLPESGDFNIVLLVNYKSLASHAPNKARYDAFMAKWSDKQVKRNEKIAETYPELREIVGEYLLSRVVFK